LDSFLNTQAHTKELGSQLSSMSSTLHTIMETQLHMDLKLQRLESSTQAKLQKLEEAQEEAFQTLKADLLKQQLKHEATTPTSHKDPPPHKTTASAATPRGPLMPVHSEASYRPSVAIPGSFDPLEHRGLGDFAMDIPNFTFETTSNSWPKDNAYPQYSGTIDELPREFISKLKNLQLNSRVPDSEMC